MDTLYSYARNVGQALLKQMEPIDMPTFDEQCRIGLKNRQECVVHTCPRRAGILFNECWNCTKHTGEETDPRPETEAVTVRVHIPEHKKNNPQDFKLGGVRNPIQAKEPDIEVDVVVPTPPEKKHTTEARIIRKPKEPKSEEKPKKYMGHFEWWDKPPGEREALENEYEVFLI